MNKVEVLDKGIVHFNAWCGDCEWRFDDYMEIPKGYRQSKKHVAETGHTVHVEVGSVTIYVPQRIPDAVPPLAGVARRGNCHDTNQETNRE